jgi:glycosyltransferase involved in cell wall biosynthesis
LGECFDLCLGMSTLHLEMPGPRGGAGVVGVARDTIRIMHVVNGEHYAGAERVQDLLAARLPEFGFTVGFACLKPDQFPRLRRCQQAPLYGMQMRSRADLRPARLLARIVRDDGYALIHSHTPRAAMVGRVAAWLAGVPLVHHVHSPTSRDSTRRAINWVNAATERLSLTGVAAAIAVSEAMGRYAASLGVPKQRITVVPNGVPTRAALPERSAPRGVWTMGVVAFFRPRKGLETLLDALAELRERHVPVRLLAVGAFETSEYEALIRARVAKLGLEDAITWTGFTSNVTAELERMDLLALPSLFGEGLPMVVLEAMASGVPIVATNVEGVPEAIRADRDGLLVPPGDASSLADAVERFIAGDVDWNAIRASAFARQHERFSDESMARGVAGVYCKVMG